MAYLRKRGDAWYYTITDADGRKIQRRGCSTKEATAAMAAQAEDKAAKIREGLIDPRDVAVKSNAAKPITEHVADYLADLKAKNRDDAYIVLITGHLRRIVEMTKAKRIDDLDPLKVQEAMKSLKDSGLSAQTCKHALRAVKQFSKWLWSNGRSNADSLVHLKPFNVDEDRRRVRRALSAHELHRLLEAAENGPDVLGISGRDRAIVYRVAMATGLRAAELRSLTPASFVDLDGPHPRIVVAAGYSKRRRNDELPIRPELAAELRPWLEGKPPGKPAYKLPEKTAKMLRVDLKAAGIDYLDASGRVADFHCLRHSFVTFLAMSDAPVRVIQSLARHSDPRLTMNAYSHVAIHDERAAIEALPDLSQAGRAEKRDRKAE
jgi:integrase